MRGYLPILALILALYFLISILFALESRAQVSPLRYITSVDLPACVYLSDLEKITNYIAVEDYVAYASVMAEGTCTMLKIGNEVQIMESQKRQGVEYVKIRLIGYDDITIWTYEKALKLKE